MFELNPPPSSAPVGCTPNAIAAADRQRWLEIARKVHSAVQEVHEIADGYAYRLPSDAQTIRDVAEYVSYDRVCCPFLRWTIRVEPEHGAVWLAMTGTGVAKKLLRENLETTDLLPLAVAQASGFDVSRRTNISGDAVNEWAERVGVTVTASRPTLP